MTRTVKFLPFAIRIIILHTITYFLFGIIASNLFDYRSLLASDVVNVYMRPFGSAFIYAGPFLQPIRGLLFAVAIWPLRNVVYERRPGWLYLWGIFLVFGILNTPAAAPCSIEGVLYTNLPIRYHLLGLPEIALQTLAFSGLTVLWEKQIQKRKGPVEGPERRPWTRHLVHAIVLACFAYMGYAVGGISLALLSGAELDLARSGSNVTLQFMFVVAFLVNTALILAVKQVNRRRRIKFWTVIVLFAAADILVPYLYQSVLLSRPPFHTSIFLGLLPTAVIAVGMYLTGYRKETVPAEGGPQSQDGQPVS